MNSSSDVRDPVELLAEEFVERRRRGERPTLDEYCARHPDLAEQIRDVFPALVMVEDLGGSSLAETGPQEKAPPPALEQIADYRILREVGRGGMGVVYEAEQESLGRRVALKVLPPHALLDAKHVARFEREARAAAKLHHTNIVPVFGVGHHEGTHFYVMQFIQGQGLDDVIEELKRLKAAPPAPTVEARKTGESLSRVAHGVMTGSFQAAKPPSSEEGVAPGGAPGANAPGSPCVAPNTNGSPVAGPAVADASGSDSSIRLPEGSEISTLSGSDQQFYRSVARIGVQVAQALDYAHSQGILHRDIKPSNLLLDLKGTVWVTDFGLAKAGDAANLTHTGDIVGTVRYMAPERFQGKSDARSDVYALGLTLYELLALKPAFDERDRLKLMQQVSHDDAPRLSKLNPRVPRDLETIVHKAMAREPERRYASAKALTEDLQRFVEDRPILARRVTTRERFWRWCRRNPALAASLGLAAAALIAVAAISVAFAWEKAQNSEDINKAYLSLENANKELKRAGKELGDAHTVLLSLYKNLKEAKDRGAKALVETQHQAALLTLEKARADAEAGEVHRGMLRLVQVLQTAPPGPDGEAIRQAARTRLAVLRDLAPSLEHRLAGAQDFHWSADGKEILYATVAVEKKKDKGDDAGVENVDVIVADAGTGGVKSRRVVPLTAPKEAFAGSLAVVLSPDGKTLCATWLDFLPFMDPEEAKAKGLPPKKGKSVGRVELWDVAAGRCLHVFPEDKDGRLLRAAAFSPDGKTIFGTVGRPTMAKGLPGGPQRDTYWLWDAASGAVRWLSRDKETFGFSSSGAKGVFSPDGKTVTLVASVARFARPTAFGREDGGICWDVASGKPIATVKLPANVDVAAFSPDSATVAVGANLDHQYEVRAYDLAGGEVRWTHTGAGELTGLEYHPDGQALLALTLGGVSEKRECRWLSAATGAAQGRAFPLGKHGGRANSGFSGVGGLGGPGSPIFRSGPAKMRIAPSGRQLLIGETDEAQAWRLSGDRLTGPLLPSRGATDVDYADAKSLLTLESVPLGFKPGVFGGGYANAVLRRWDAASGDLASEVEMHGPPTGVLHSGTQRVAFRMPQMKSKSEGSFGPLTQIIEVWDATPKRLASFEPGGNPTPILRWSNDGRFLLTHPAAGVKSKGVVGKAPQTKIQLWEAETGKLVNSWDGLGRPAAAFHPDGKHLLVIGSGFGRSHVYLWPLEGEPPAKSTFELPNLGQVSYVMVHPGGRKFLVASRSVLKLFNLDDLSGPELATEGADALFSRDGRYLVVHDGKNELRFFDLAVGDSFSLMLDHPRPLNPVGFSPDGSKLLTLDDASGAVRQWSVPAPLPGDTDRLLAWVETSTGLELGPRGFVNALDAAKWHERKAALAKLGGAPPAGYEPIPWHLRQALKHMHSDNLAGVLWHTQRRLAEQPDDWRALFWQARAYTDLGHRAEALAAFERSLKAIPQSDVLAWWRTYDEVALMVNDREEDMAALREALSVASGGKTLPSTLFLTKGGTFKGKAPVVDEAAKQALAREWKQAARALEESLAANPDDHWLYYRLAGLHMYTGDRERYSKVCQEMLDRFAEHKTTNYGEKAAKLYFLALADVKDPKLPYRLLDRAIEEKGPYVATYYQLSKGFAEYRAGNWQAAIDVIEAVLPKFDSRFIEVYAAEGRLFQAMAYHRLGNDALAKKMLADAERLIDAYGDKESEPTASNWHEQLFALTVQREAVKLITGKELVEKPLPPRTTASTKTALARDRLGEEYTRAKDWQKAIELYEKAVADNPLDDLSRSYLGALLLHTDQRPSYLKVSEEMFRRFAADPAYYLDAKAARLVFLDPEPPNPKLPFLLVDAALAPKGKKDLRYDYHLLYKGFAEYRAGNWQAAIDVIDQALPLMNKKDRSRNFAAEGHLVKAMAHHRLKQDSQAREQLAEASRHWEEYDAGKRTPGTDLDELLFVLTLRREAEMLILGK